MGVSGEFRRAVKKLMENIRCQAAKRQKSICRYRVFCETYGGWELLAWLDLVQMADYGYSGTQ